MVNNFDQKVKKLDQTGGLDIFGRLLGGAGPSRGRLPRPLEVVVVSGRFRFLAFFFNIQSARDEPFEEDLIGASNDSKSAIISGRTSMTSSASVTYLSRLCCSISFSAFGK